jgi:probable F420-dependent oxidoreductase
MKIGVNILNFGPGTNLASLERWAQLAEALGYHFAMISDHVAVTSDVHSQYPAPYYDPFIALAWLAGVTKNLELGATVVILPYRHPLLTARMAANIDQLCRGRFILGVGVGWAKQEFQALGVPFEQRGAIANEYLAVIKKCWANDVVSHEGRYVSFREVHTGPRPVRSPHPPVWVGGRSEPAMRRAARYGDAWHPLRFRMDWLANEGLPALRKIVEAEGAPVPALCPRIHLHLTDSPLEESTRLAGDGTADQIRRDLETLAGLGAEYVLFDTYGGKPEDAADFERDWTALAILAERIAGLKQR